MIRAQRLIAGPAGFRGLPVDKERDREAMGNYGQSFLVLVSLPHRESIFVLIVKR